MNTNNRKEFRQWIKSNCPRLSRKELRKLYSAPDMEACKKKILDGQEERRKKREQLREQEAQSRKRAKPLTPAEALLRVAEDLSSQSPVMSQMMDSLKKDIGL